MATGPTLNELFQLFPAEPVPEHVEVPAEAIPFPYAQLLVHPHHMTVTVEEFYHGPVSVRVIRSLRDTQHYARMIVLDHERAGVVLFGIVRIRLDCCGEEVRKAIEDERTPLGRILIQHEVLRRIEPTQFLQFPPGPVLQRHFEQSTPAATYGRLGIIFCDDRPAVELLEVLAPMRPST